ADLRPRGKCRVHAPRERQSVQLRAIEVPARPLVLRLYDLRERLHRGDVHLLDSLERMLELATAYPLQRIQLAQLPGEDHELRLEGGELGILRKRPGAPGSEGDNVLHELPSIGPRTPGKHLNFPSWECLSPSDVRPSSVSAGAMALRRKRSGPDSSERIPRPG